MAQPDRSQDERLRRQDAISRVEPFPVGTKVRFLKEQAPNAYRKHGRKVATVVTRNLADGELGLTFGWAGSRIGMPDTMRWSGNEALVWALPREVEIVPPKTKPA